MRLLDRNARQPWLGPVVGLILGLLTSSPTPVAWATSALPTLTLDSPFGGATVSGSVTLSARASEAGITSVQFLLSGAPIGSPISSGACRTTWDTRPFADGAYTLSAVGQDGSGNSIYASPIVVYVQNVAPTVSNLLAEEITTTSAWIRWQTSQPADGRVEYGPAATFGFSTQTAPTLVVNHLMALTGLTPGTAYYYRVHSRTENNIVITSPAQVFTTAAEPPPPPPPPPPSDGGGSTDGGGSSGGGTTNTVSTTGTIRDIGTRLRPNWVIRAVDGTLYAPTASIPAHLKKSGQKVAFSGTIVGQTRSTVLIDLTSITARR